MGVKAGDFEIALREREKETGLGADDWIIYKVSEYKANGRDRIVKYWLAELRDASEPVVISHRHDFFFG